MFDHDKKSFELGASKILNDEGILFLYLYLQLSWFYFFFLQNFISGFEHFQIVDSFFNYIFFLVDKLKQSFNTFIPLQSH